MNMAFLSAHDNLNWIFCTHCIHSPVPAVKSCLVCEVFVCDGHMTVHSNSAQHVLFDPTTSQENRKCSVHKNMLESYISEETCPTKEVLESQIKVMGEKLKNVHKKLTCSREETEKRVHCLQEHRRKIQERAMASTEKATLLFRDIRRHLEDLEQRVTFEIARQEQQASLSVSDLIKQLELKKEELSRKICHIEALCHMTNPLMALQNSDKEEENMANDELDCDVDYLDEDLIFDTLYQDLLDIVTRLQKSHRSQEHSHILLDLNTAADNVYITPCLQTACITILNQNRPESPMRFQFNQVFSSNSFSSGRHYWDFLTDESGEWRVGVSYSSLDRDGDQAYIGSNSKSWCLWGHYNKYYVLHDNTHKYIPLSSCMFRIYLDYEAGQLSFYELGDPVRHLYTFSTKFTEPLHAAFYVCRRSWIGIRNSD